MRRREFLQQSAALVLAVAADAGCRRTTTRESVLSGIVHDAVVPDMNAIRGTSRTLDAAMARFDAAPTEGSLLEARSAFHAALVRWKRGGCLRKGPLIASGALLRTTFWPIRIGTIDELITSSDAIDEARIDDLAADLKGFYALEYLLFGVDKVDASVPPHFSGEHGARARRLAAALAANVRKWSDRVAVELGSGAPLADELAKDGQASINYLVNQMAGTVEGVARKLRDVLDLALRARLTPRNVEGWPSGASTDILETLVGGTEAFYSVAGGRGLATLVTPVAPRIEPRVRAAFADARRTLLDLAAPVEVAALNRRPAVERAARAAKALEVSLKVDLASALGVTITFSSVDGD